MLTISARSLSALSTAAREPARSKLIAALRQSLPNETARYKPDELEIYCDRGISEARQYGFDTEYGAYVYVAAMLVYNEGFDRDPRLSRVHEVLRSNVVDQQMKAKALELQIAIDSGTRI
jgi:hypothetical protein